MPRGVKNWTFKAVVKFLEQYSFFKVRSTASHFHYRRVKTGVTYQVTVPKHGSRAISPRVINNIIKNSGIPKDDWLK